MDQRVKNLPISAGYGSGQRRHVTRRLGQFLAPSTRMKQWTYAGLIMLILSSVYQIDLLAAVAYPILIVCGAYYLWKVGGLLRDRLFWKVRNRILASFIFAGALPICLVALIGLIVVWFLIGAMGTNRTARQFEETIDRLHHIPTQIQLELYRTALSGKFSLTDAVNKTLQANRDLPHLSISVFERRGKRLSLVSTIPPDSAVTDLPAWAADSSFAGIVTDDLAASFRAISGIEIKGRNLYILASIPLDQEYQRVVRERSGIVLSGLPFSVIRRRERRLIIPHPPGDLPPLPPLDGSLSPPADVIPPPKTDQVDQAWGVGVIHLPWGSPFRAIEWEEGPRAGLSNGVPERSSRLLFLTMSIDPVWIVRDSLTGDFDIMNRLVTALIALCASLAVVELISFSIGFVISRRITSAVHNLSLATQAIRSGNLDFRIETRKHDQLGELAHSFNAMAQSIQVLLVEVADKQRIEAELAMARDVQAQFFPKRIPRIGRLELAGTCMPARMVSGDYYDFIVHGETILDIVVSDISGKGMAAALMMAGLQSALRSQTMRGDIEPRPGRLVRTVSHLNRYLCRNTAPDKFATLFLSSYDPKSSTLSYCCAGHNPPYLFQNGTILRLTKGGIPIGLFPDWSYEEATVKLSEGNLFVMYTDGVTEAQNQREEEFGEQRLERVIRDHAGRSCEDIQSRILAAVRDFAYGAEQYDDQTIVVGRVR